MTSSDPVLLPPLNGPQLAAWEALLDLAPALGNNWTLIGGQMVLLHQAERGALARPETEARFSVDLDVVIDARAKPRALSHANALLISAGFEQDTPDRFGTAHRYRLGDAVIDILAPRPHRAQPAAARNRRDPGSPRRIPSTAKNRNHHCSNRGQDSPDTPTQSHRGHHRQGQSRDQRDLQTERQGPTLRRPQHTGRAADQAGLHHLRADQERAKAPKRHRQRPSSSPCHQIDSHFPGTKLKPVSKPLNL